MTVHSPKTEHHEGHESRVMPIFAELRPYLEDVFTLAQEAAEAEDCKLQPTDFVITRYRQKNVNLRTQLLRIVAKAGSRNGRNCSTTSAPHARPSWPTNTRSRPCASG